MSFDPALAKQILNALPMAAWYEMPDGDTVKNAAAHQLDPRFWELGAQEIDESVYQIMVDGPEPAEYTVFRESLSAPAEHVVLGVALEAAGRGVSPGPRDEPADTDGALWRAVVEELEEAIVLVDRAGLVADLNRAASRVLGVSCGDAVGSHYSSVVRGLACVNGVSLVEQRLREPTPAPSSESCELRTADGAIRYVKLTVRPVRRGNEQYLVMTIVDQTDTRQLEHETHRAQRLETLGSIAAGLAHDFNNLLTTAIGNLSMMRQAADHEEQTELVDAASRALERGRRLNAQLLSFPKRPHLEWQNKNAGEIVEEAARFALRGSNVAGRFLVDPDIGNVQLDGDQLSHVVENLVVNAEQAMPDGGVVEVRVSRGATTPERVTVSVKDQGPGIPRSLRDRIFEPYFTTANGQSGLGLAVAKSIVTHAGGEIGVDSRPGGGTTVTVVLPARPEEVVSAPVDEVARHLRLLVMDDDDSVRQTLSRMLERLGCVVAGARDGIEAVYLYQTAREHRRPYDLVVLDLTVPGAMGGREALTRIRRDDPNVRAVATSGYASDPVMVAPRDHGFYGAIAKPYTLEELSRAIAQSVSVH